MKKIFLLTIAVCFLAVFQLSAEEVYSKERCETCVSFQEAMQRDLPELFKDAAFAAAGGDFNIRIPASDASRNLPSNDVTTTSVIPLTVTVVTPPPLPEITPPPPPEKSWNVQLSGKKNLGDTADGIGSRHCVPTNGRTECFE